MYPKFLKSHHINNKVSMTFSTYGLLQIQKFFAPFCHPIDFFSNFAPAKQAKNTIIKL